MKRTESKDPSHCIVHSCLQFVSVGNQCKLSVSFQLYEVHDDAVVSGGKYPAISEGGLFPLWPSIFLHLSSLGRGVAAELDFECAGTLEK